MSTSICPAASKYQGNILDWDRRLLPKGYPTSYPTRGCATRLRPHLQTPPPPSEKQRKNFSRSGYTA